MTGQKTDYMRTKSWEKRIRWIWGACLLLIWSCAIALFVRTNGWLSVDELLHFRPESKLMAVLAMLGLFMLKSVDFLINSGVLYAVSAILFPLPAALALNLAGAAIVSAVPYCVGHSLGAPLLAHIRRRYPKLRRLEAVQTKGVFFFALLMRCAGIPVCIVGVYFGADKSDFQKYMAGSVLGLMPMIIPYTILGSSAADYHSPVFITAIGVRVLVLILSAFLYRHLLRKEKAQDVSVTDTIV